MSKLTIARTGAPMPTTEELDGLRRLLFGLLRGLRPEDEKAWRRFWKIVTGAEAGEMFNLEVVFPRNPKFHRKFFALLTVGFDAWEPSRKHKTYKGQPVAKNFERFREEVTILAGYYDQVFDLKGRMKLEAKSISFAKMDDAEFDQLYSAVADVLLDQVLHTYAGRSELDAVVQRVMEFNV